VGDSRGLSAGDAGRDTLQGAVGIDLLIGDNDVPDGTAEAAAADSLNGGAMTDDLRGDNVAAHGNAAGKDTLTDTSGSNHMVGDNYGFIASAAQADVITGGSSGADVIIGDNWSAGSAYAAGNDTIRSGGAPAGSSEQLVGDNRVSGTESHGGGNDSITAGNGNDLIVGDSLGSPTGEARGGGDDTINGGGGNDGVIGDNWGFITMIGGGMDTLNGAAGDDSLVGGPSRDSCAGSTGTDTATTCEAITGVP
jgi:hypothetical protein